MFDEIFSQGTRDDPLRLRDIIFAWDRQQRVIPTLDELESVVRSQIERGAIVELAPGQYARSEGPDAPRRLTPIAQALYDRELAAYRDLWKKRRPRSEPSTGG